MVQRRGIVAVSGLLPILIGTILNALGIVNIGSGLGLGLLFFFCGLLAAVLFVVGSLLERSTQN
jgi:hypothetical protein